MKTRKQQYPDKYNSMENSISLRQFSPILRKLGKFLLKYDHPITISVACAELNLNKESVYSSIWRSKKNGNDFNKFIDEHAKSILKANKMAVYDRLIERAVSDASASHNDRKTYFQLTGDLKDETTNVNINVLSVSAPVNIIPPDINQDKGVVDVEVLVPSDEE